MACSVNRPQRKEILLQGNVKVRLNPVKKIPLNPPLIKGDLRFPLFNKGGVRGDFEIKGISC
jgi:hypothetical protein